MDDMRQLTTSVFGIIGVLVTCFWTFPAFADNTPPEAFALLAPKNGVWASATPLFEWEKTTDADSGVSHYELWIDGQAVVTPIAPGSACGWSKCSLQLDVMYALSEGFHTWTVYAVDGADNPKQAVQTWTVKIDATPPSGFNVVSPPGGTYTPEKQVGINWEASTDAGSGLDKYVLTISGPNSEKTVEFDPLTTQTTEELPTTLVKYISAWGASYQCDDVWYEQQGSCCGKDDGYFLLGLHPGNQAAVISYIPGIDLSTVGHATLTFNHASNSPEKLLSPGVGLRSKKVSNQDFNRYFYFDPPVDCSKYCNGCSCDGCFKTPGNYSTEQIDVSGVSGEEVKFWFFVYRKEGYPDLTIGEGIRFDGLVDGAYCISVKALDKVGNFESAAQKCITYDAPPLPFDLLVPAHKVWHNPDVPVLFEWESTTDATTDIAEYRLVVDEQAVQEGILPSAVSFELTDHVWTDGEHEWWIEAVDESGAVRRSRQWYTIKIDGTPPSPFGLLGPSDGSVASLPTPEFSWESSSDWPGSGLDHYELWVDDELAADDIAGTASTPSVPLSQGLHTWHVEAVDKVGNKRKSTQSWELIVDWSPPQAFELVSPCSETVSVGAVEFLWEPSLDDGGIEKYELWLDNQLLVEVVGDATQYVPEVPVSTGAHSWFAKAYDYAGGEAASNTCSFNVVQCAEGESVPCEGLDVGECSPGTKSCTAQGTWGACEDEVVPVDELCDLKDNDCDGAIDEDFLLGAVCSVGVGECTAFGEEVCSPDGLDTVCSVLPGIPTDELCDSKDNDCDGLYDEDFPELESECSAGVGECTNWGVYLCAGDGVGTACSAAPLEPMLELCDGLDNDCDETVDEDYVALGQECVVGIGACANTGEFVCSEDGLETVCSAKPNSPALELCDAEDNDCDGQVDEGFELGDACTVGTGECQQEGQSVCADDGSEAVCDVVPLDPQAELCDGLDNDCDGEVDNGYDVGVACTIGLGECQAEGVIVCEESGQTECDAQTIDPTSEKCNGKDDDCDGEIDEIFLGLGNDCSVGVGACAVSGTIVCAEDGEGVHCDASPGEPSEEICDGIDNDCDDIKDNGYPTGIDCVTGLGECLSKGTLVCADDGSDVVCDAVAGEPEQEICGDGLDNDCDGAPDNGCECQEGEEQTCGTSLGECEQGVVVCVEGKFGACEGAVFPEDEIPGDGLDNDCDGVTDEGSECLDGVDEPKECGTDIGVCETGVMECLSGKWSDCEGAVLPSAELCNELDDDCDGDADEDFADLSEPCFAGLGQCEQEGVYVCSETGQSTVCDAVPGDPEDEVCGDELDNDCDGDVDESCGEPECEPGEEVECETGDPECPTGSAVCDEDGQWGECSPGCYEPDVIATVEQDDVINHEVTLPVQQDALNESYRQREEASGQGDLKVSPDEAGVEGNDSSQPGNGGSASSGGCSLQGSASTASEYLALLALLLVLLGCRALGRTRLASRAPQ